MKSSFARWALVFAALSAALLGLYAAPRVRRASGGTPDGPGVEVQAGVTAGALHPKENRELIVIVTNRTGRDVRVVGATDVCNEQACVSALRLPLVIPPHASYPLSVKVRGGATPGDFRQEITLYTDCPGRTMVALMVTGRLVASPSP